MTNSTTIKVEFYRNYIFLQALINDCYLQLKHLTIETEIVSVEKKLKNYLERKEKYDKTLIQIKKVCSDSEFKVFYYHYFQGFSLSETAKKMHYSKGGITKILNKINRKVGTICIPS